MPASGPRARVSLYGYELSLAEPNSQPSAHNGASRRGSAELDADEEGCQRGETGQRAEHSEP